MANLNSVDLSESNLSGANLSGTNLSGANLGNCLMVGANLSGADLSNANLTSTTLILTNLSQTNLTNVKLNDEIDWFSSKKTYYLPQGQDINEVLGVQNELKELYETQLQSVMPIEKIIILSKQPNLKGAVMNPEVAIQLEIAGLSIEEINSESLRKTRKFQDQLKLTKYSRDK